MIKLSKKWSYAIKAMVYLALNSDKLVNISEISEKQKIPQSLLRRIIADLDKTSLIETTKWRNGWIKITKRPKEITIYDILFSVWEELWVTDCSKWLICDNHNACSTFDFYAILQKWLNGILKIYTLDKIIKSKR